MSHEQLIISHEQSSGKMDGHTKKRLINTASFLYDYQFALKTKSVFYDLAKIPCHLYWCIAFLIADWCKSSPCQRRFVHTAKPLHPDYKENRYNNSYGLCLCDLSQNLVPSQHRSYLVVGLAVWHSQFP